MNVNRSNNQRAFTLIEVLLVLALLVVVAAIAAPRLAGSTALSDLRRATEQVRTHWGEARREAMSTGRTMRFQCRIGENVGFVADAANVAAAAQADATATSEHSERELAGVVFRQLLVAPMPGDESIGGEVNDGELSAAVLFYPDGSTSDAECLLEAGTRRTRITLRGLTGAATTADATGDDATGDDATGEE